VILFTGHTHYASIVCPGAIAPNLTCIGCPSLCCWPHAFLSVEITAHSIDVRTIRVLNDYADSPDSHAHDLVERALYEGSESDRAITVSI
jgi:hypothetical protein